MKKYTLILAFIAFAGFSGCNSLKMSTTKSMGIYGAGIVQNPVLVDLEVNERKVTGMATGFEKETLDLVKQQAVADALKIAEADVLVEPKFETEIRNGRITVSATGFPANYKNFRSFTPKDTELLTLGITQKVDVYEPSVKKKNGLGRIALGILAGGVASMLIIVPLL